MSDLCMLRKEAMFWSIKHSLIGLKASSLKKDICLQRHYSYTKKLLFYLFLGCSHSAAKHYFNRELLLTAHWFLFSWSERTAAVNQPLAKKKKKKERRSIWVKWWDRDDEVLHTCSAKQYIITGKTVIKIGYLLIMISLDERFRASLDHKHACFQMQSFIFRFVTETRDVFLTHLAVIAFHMIVFVHGYNSNGFIRPLERNSDRQTQLKPI